MHAAAVSVQNIYLPEGDQGNESDEGNEVDEGNESDEAEEEGVCARIAEGGVEEDVG